jgi:chemotaxis protein methyltransferase CheR
MGLHFPPERWSDLERGLGAAAQAWDAPDVESYVRQLLEGPLTKKQVEILASELTVGETYFFRDQRSFEALREKILPELKRTRREGQRPLRIWSAGCCTGEEPYSIAILLDRLQWELGVGPVTILGTDINPRFLQKAARGIFSEWSFRDAPPWLKENYFKPVAPHSFEILPRIKDRVTFAYLNLAEDVYPSLANNTNAMDLIFCRNVLMYFTPERTKKVVHNFYRALTDSSWLVVNPTEASPVLFSLFHQKQEGGTIFYWKGNSSALSVQDLGAEVRPEWRPEEGEMDLSSLWAEKELLPLVQESAEGPAVLEPAKDDSSLGREVSVLLTQGQYEEARHKLSTNPDGPIAPELLVLWARFCANRGALTEACQWVDQAIAADKLNPAVHYLRAIILQEQGASEEGRAALQRTLYLDPDFVLAHFALGDQAWRQKKYAEADKYFANTLALLADYPPDSVLPHSDGLAAGRLREMVESTRAIESAA